MAATTFFRTRIQMFTTLFLLLIILTSASCDYPPPPPPPPEDAEYKPIQTRSLSFPESGIDLGWGWNSVEEQSVPSVCIEFSLTEEKGQTKQMSMKEVSDSYEVMEAMGMSASASVKTFGFKASGKAEYAKNTKVTGFQSTFVLNALVENGVRYVAPLQNDEKDEKRDSSGGPNSLPDQGQVRLTDEALSLAKRKDLRGFYDLCGDSFVTAIYGGARLLSVISIQVSSYSEQEKISAEMKGSGWGVDVSAKVSNATGTEKKNQSNSMTFFQTGGKGDAMPEGKDALMERLRTLPQQAVDAPKNFRMVISPYTAVANWPDKPIELDLSDYEQLASYFGSYLTIYEEIEYALNNKDQFYAASLVEDKPDKNATAKYEILGSNANAIQRLRDLQDNVLAGLNKLRQRVLECSQPDAVCEFKPEDDDMLPSPYLHRLKLPVPDTLVAEKEIKDAVDLVINYHIRDNAKRRCAISPFNEGCLTNKQIDDYKVKFEKLFEAKG